MAGKQLVTAPKLGEILDIKEDGIWRLARQGKIPVVKIGRHMRFDVDDVMAALKGQSK
jgi:excisionase family DNA binding protein